MITSDGSGALIFGQRFMSKMRQILSSSICTIISENALFQPSKYLSYLTGRCTSKTKVPSKTHGHFKGNTTGYINEIIFIPYTPNSAL